MHTEEHQNLLAQILQAIEQDDFILPTLPDVAIKLQRLIDDPNISADQIVSVLSSDPFVSAQIIKSANSATYAGMPQVDSVREAATRLGFRQLRNVVLTITMNKLLYSKNPVIHQQMRLAWEHSRKVAAISYVLALRQPQLVPDQATLAGLMHNIGVLPLCMHIEQNHVPIESDTLEALVRKCHSKIGAKLLKQWNFPPEIIHALAEHHDIHRESSKLDQADYVDVVTIANLLGSANSIAVAWNNVAAASRLGLSEEKCRTFIENNSERIERIEILLGMKPKPKPHTLATMETKTQKITPFTSAKKVDSQAHENSGLLSSLMKLWK